MAYTKAHLVFRIGGFFSANGTTALEEWSTGCRIDVGSGVVSEGQKADFLEAVQSPIAGFHASSAGGAHQSCYLNRLTAAYVDVDGKYLGGADQPTTEREFAPVGGFASTGVSWDVARTISLLTSRDRGRASRGRMYWPCGALTASDGRWAAADILGSVGAALTMLDAINTAAAAAWAGSEGICVFSELGLGTTAKVIRVEIGRAPDTQRRRTKSLLEEYQGADLAGALALREGLANWVYDR